MAKKPVKPVQTIVKKRSLLVPALSLIVLLLVAAAVFLFAKNQSRSEILATVNGEPIYADDIEAEYSRLPEAYQVQYTRETILDQTIDKLLLLQEAERRGISVSNDEINNQLNDIMAQFGIGLSDLKALLEAQNLTLEEYRQFIKEELLINKVIEDVVISRIAISDKEVAEYYDSHPEEFSTPLGGAVVSHILVDNESAAKQIISRLGLGESFAELAEQRSIDPGTKNDGGYLGIVTNESLYVPEFKAAALNLKQNKYTRTPVQTQFGYHVILRHEDQEPLRLVKSRIEKQLKIQKQIELFQEFMGGLRESAVIKRYTESGIVTDKPKTASLDSFASCVSEKATLYGTTWSEFFKEQQALFGESFNKLTVVDCDEKPHLCSAANIQKYPTWIVANTDEHLGKLSLQELSEKTGCELQG